MIEWGFSEGTTLQEANDVVITADAQSAPSSLSENVHVVNRHVMYLRNCSTSGIMVVDERTDIDVNIPSVTVTVDVTLLIKRDQPGSNETFVSSRSIAPGLYDKSHISMPLISCC